MIVIFLSTGTQEQHGLVTQTSQTKDIGSGRILQEDVTKIHIGEEVNQTTVGTMKIVAQSSNHGMVNGMMRSAHQNILSCVKLVDCQYDHVFVVRRLPSSGDVKQITEERPHLIDHE